MSFAGEEEKSGRGEERRNWMRWAHASRSVASVDMINSSNINGGMSSPSSSSANPRSPGLKTYFKTPEGRYKLHYEKTHPSSLLQYPHGKTVTQVFVSSVWFLRKYRKLWEIEGLGVRFFFLLFGSWGWRYLFMNGGWWDCLGFLKHSNCFGFSVTSQLFMFLLIPYVFSGIEGTSRVSFSPFRNRFWWLAQLTRFQPFKSEVKWILDSKFGL